MLARTRVVLHKASRPDNIADMPDLILLEEANGVASVTLNRPDRLNAFADDMREQLGAALDQVAHFPGARVLLLTGAGRAFCSGGDVRHMVDLKQRGAGFDALQPLLDAGRAVIARLAALPIPTIAAVNGAAAGAGLNLALACDLRIASDQATFGQTFARIGLHPDWGGSYFLPRAIGLGPALEMSWLGDMIGADEALRIGLVNRVVPHDRLADEARSLAARLAAAPERPVRLVKASFTASAHRTLEECLDAEAGAQAACWNSADAAEGLRAFVEKRSPKFGPSERSDAGDGAGAAPSDAGEETGAAPSAAARRFE